MWGLIFGILRYVEKPIVFSIICFRFASYFVCVCIDLSVNPQSLLSVITPNIWNEF